MWGMLLYLIWLTMVDMKGAKEDPGIEELIHTLSVPSCRSLIDVVCV